MNKVSYERDNYIKNNSCKEIIYVPKLPNHKYIWWPDFDEKFGQYYPHYYKMYMKLPDDLKFIFLDYDEWLVYINTVSTCS